MTRVMVGLVAALVLGGCAERQVVPAAAFLAPGVRAAQESACARAVAARSPALPGAVSVRRASSDAQNWSIVNFRVGPANGYCRVDVNANVLQVVL